jgi:hypothetical protein
VIVGCYTSHFYCENEHGAGSNTPVEITGGTLAETIREARRRGWRINRKNLTAICPECARKGKVEAGQ